MPPLASCHALSKTYDERQLFDGITLSFADTDRIGLIGANGSGKSTLLKIMCGLESADQGEIALTKGRRMAYLPQEDALDPDASVWQLVYGALRGAEIDDTERQVRTQRALSRATFADTEQHVHTLSGGWRKRLALTCALVQEADLLLLDEPTNHLDLDGVLWLEALLRQADFAFVLVTHDRAFLQHCCNGIVELDHHYVDGFLRVSGNYHDFLAQREQRRLQQEKQHTALATKAKRELEWLNSSPKARTTKARARVESAERLQQDVQQSQARQARDRSLKIDFEGSGKKSKKLLEIKDISHSFAGRKLFAELGLLLSPGRRVGLLGGNGTGKSTLLKILAGQLAPDRGEVRAAQGARVLLFEQDRSSLDPQLSLRRALSPGSDTVIYRGQSQHVVGWGARFLFRAEQLDMPVASLSGGEQARILLARLMLQPADVLLLDEPTNDLDIPALEVLEQSLLEFPGAIVLVSHDRYLLDRVCDAVLGLDGQGGVHACADHLQWQRVLAEQKKPKDPIQKKQKARSKADAPPRLTYAEMLELPRLEAQISVAESARADAEKLVQVPEVTQDPMKLRDAVQRLEQSQQVLEKLYARWEELELKKQLSEKL